MRENCGSPPLAAQLQQPIEAYLKSREVPRESLEKQLAQLQVMAGDGTFSRGDVALDFAMSMIHLKMLEGGTPPAMLLFDIIDIAQFGQAYFHDERSLNEFVAMIRMCLDETD